MKRPGVWQTVGVAGGVVGAAATTIAVSAAGHMRRTIARDRRRLALQSSHGIGEPGADPPGEASSVVADDGVRLSCEHLEPVSGRPPELTVVLVHGFALDRRTWHFQRATLARLTDPAVRVVLYDQRSHGRSERASRDSCTIDQLGRDLDAVIRSLAPDGPLVIAGHSMGGMTVMALAEQRPELFVDRVVGVALASTSAGAVGGAGLPAALLSRHNPFTWGVGLLARVQPTLVDVVRGVAGDLIWAITRRFAYGDRNVAPWLVDLVDTMISTNAVDALTDFVDTVGSHNRIAALPALSTCEVLVTVGEADRVIPSSHSIRIAAELPDARLVRFPGVGHLPMLERPGSYDEALVDLVRRSSARFRSGRRTG